MPISGNIYVSWTSVDVNTAIPIPDFNPNRIKVEVSSDGGNNFSPITIADVNSYAARRRQRPDESARGHAGNHGQPGPPAELRAG